MKRSRRLTSPHAIAILALVVALASPAWGDPVAHTAASLGKTVKQALSLSKKANKRSKSALKKANRALAKGGPTGATGATGPRGPDGPGGLQGNQGPQGPAGTAVAFARVALDGTLEGGSGDRAHPNEQQKNVDAGDVQHDAVAGATTTGPGVYCFGGIPFRITSAMVSADSAANSGSTNKIASVAIQRGNNLDGCNSTHQQARVSMLAVNDTVAPTLTNARFQIWFEGVPDSTPPSPINPPVD